MRIAIMQPYFIPYAGYFRLFQSTDLFVAYDCVQFPRRGWLHRNKLPNQQGELDWLTLPLERAPQDTAIASLAFASDAHERLTEQFNKFPLFKSAEFLNSEFHEGVQALNHSPVEYIINTLRLSCKSLHIPFNIVRSSELKLPSDIKGQDRIIAIARHFKATQYINAPGGIDLYNKQSFDDHGIKLTFLSEYAGPYQSILPRLLKEDTHLLRHEIFSQSAGV